MGNGSPNFQKKYMKVNHTIQANRSFCLCTTDRHKENRFLWHNVWSYKRQKVILVQLKYLIFITQLNRNTYTSVCCWQRSIRCRKAPQISRPAESHTDSASSGNTSNCGKDSRKMGNLHLQQRSNKTELYSTGMYSLATQSTQDLKDDELKHGTWKSKSDGENHLDNILPHLSTNTKTVRTSSGSSDVFCDQVKMHFSKCK